ncbi:hypothetical protein MMF93_30845 [Streptomyces tubbatahanensis]|uniref:Uncharacterized protein n=1 Tax=Streptomyces tubbatahanensis TaxID=2923272 RepID=A0ABY3Y173_9ACTN|nr:hypothetical protein [Streptomyces tubbatahanensis]UNT00376.1 hypothetical protein MMF93_30845 [Streptomyces tubbatahanensis]
MGTPTAERDPRLSFWLRVREFAVPPSMIATATARRLSGDWAGACAAAHLDVDLDLRSVARTRGRELAARIRNDLRHLAPDLLRWHMPRIAPDGLLRPGLTLSLARYDTVGPGGAGPVHLVARTPPAWADAGQRFSLALWDASRSGPDAPVGIRHHPHPRPHRRFRLDLHRHLWDVRSADELLTRSGADRPPTEHDGDNSPELPGARPWGQHCPIDRWAAEADILLRSEGRSAGAVIVRLGVRHRLFLDLLSDDDGSGRPARLRGAAATDGSVSRLPVLPEAATWTLPDLALLRAGLLEAGQLHPLVASALAPERSPTDSPVVTEHPGGPQIVECRGARHRIGLADGVLTPLDHDPSEIRREELLAALSGTPLPCLQAVDRAQRRPECFAGVRERLAHGDNAGALAAVESLLGTKAVLRSGALRNELEAAAQRRVTYHLFREGLVGAGPGRDHPKRRRSPDHRSHPRDAAPH